MVMVMVVMVNNLIMLDERDGLWSLESGVWSLVSDL